jgi:hypothetical protein
VEAPGIELSDGGGELLKENGKMSTIEPKTRASVRGVELAG